MPNLNKSNASPLLVIIAFAFIYIVWGSTYFFIKIALEGFPPFILGAIRFIIAGFLMMAWCIIRGEEVFIKKNIKAAVISGILMLFVGNGVVVWVEQYMPSAMVAIVLSAAPIWFVLLDKENWLLNFKSKSVIAGLIIGFIGVILLFSEHVHTMFSTRGNSIQLICMFLLIMGSISWAGGSLYSKKNLLTGSAAVNTSWQILAGGFAFIPGVFFRGEINEFHWENISTNAWLSLIYLILMGSIAGFTAYVWLLKVRPATQVSTHAYVNPVVAVLLGVFFANEKITFMQIIGLVVILGSVMLINLAKYNQERKAVRTDVSRV